MEILEQSNRLYSSRYQLPLIAFCTLHLCDAFVRYSHDEPVASAVARFCLQAMQQNRAGFELCGPLQELFRRTAVELKVELPHDVQELMEPQLYFGINHVLDACTRLSYTPPIEQALRHIDPSVPQEWQFQWRNQIDSHAGRGRKQSQNERYLQIHSLLNG